MNVEFKLLQHDTAEIGLTKLKTRNLTNTKMDTFILTFESLLRKTCHKSAQNGMRNEIHVF